MRKTLLLLSLLCIFTALSARGSREDQPPGILYQGKITVKGTEPHTWTALTLADGTIFALAGPLEEILRQKYQNKTVYVEGTVIQEPLGPGMPAQLEVIRIKEEIKKGE